MAVIVAAAIIIGVLVHSVIVAVIIAAVGLLAIFGPSGCRAARHRLAPVYRHPPVRTQEPFTAGRPECHTVTGMTTFLG